MNSAQQPFLRPGSAMTEPTLSNATFRSSVSGAAGKGKFQTIEQRRRQGYMRLARTVWVSLLNSRQPNIKAQQSCWTKSR